MQTSSLQRCRGFFTFSWHLGVLYTQCIICWCCKSTLLLKWISYTFLRYVKKIIACPSLTHPVCTAAFLKKMSSGKVLSVLKFPLCITKKMKECHGWFSWQNLQFTVLFLLSCQCEWFPSESRQLKCRPYWQLSLGLSFLIDSVCGICFTGAKTCGLWTELTV